MSMRIDVANGTLDLLPDAEQRFYVTKQLHDLHDLETREGDFTKTLTIPYSSNNLLLLAENTPEWTRHGTQGTRFIPCQLLIDGVSVLNEPVLRIESGNDEGFSITIFSGSVGFFIRLSEDPISSLNWDDLNFDWNEANLLARRNNSTGLVYPHNAWIDNTSFNQYILEGGNVVQDRINGMSIPNSGFYIYFREVIDRIMAEMSGLTLNYGDLDADPLFNTTAFANRMNLLRASYKGSNSGYQGRANAPNLVTVAGASNFKSLIVAVGTPVNISLVNNEYVIQETGDANVFFLTPVFFINIGFSMTVSIMRNDEVINSQTLIGNLLGSSFFLTIRTNFSVNDRVWFRVTTTGQSSVNVGFSFELQTFMSRSSGGSTSIDVQIQDYLPEISQRSFVKSVLAMFNMVVTEKDNVITFSSWEKIAGAAPIEIDFDPSRPLTESGIFSGYGINNILKYSDSNLINRTDQDASFPVNVAGIDETVTKIELPFFPADESQIDGGRRASIPSYAIQTVNEIGNQFTGVLGTSAYTTSENTGLKVGDVIIFDNGIAYARVASVFDKNNGTLDVGFFAPPNVTTNWRYIRFNETQAPLPQIATMNQVTGESFLLTNGTLQSTTAGDFKRALFSSQLTFSFLMDNYFRNLVSSMISPFTLTAWFHIDILQFIEIDQLRPFYLSSYAATFYVNKIEQYKSKGLVRIELLQIGASTGSVADSEGLQVGAFDDSFSDAFDNYSQNEI